MIGWDADNGGMVAPVCPLEDLNAQFDSIMKPMKGTVSLARVHYEGADSSVI